MPTAQQNTIINALTTAKGTSVTGQPNNTINTWYGIYQPGQAQSVSLSYSFITSLPSYYSSVTNISTFFDTTTVAGFSASQRTVTTDGAMKAWESFANITLSKITDNNLNAVITLGNANFVSTYINKNGFAFNAPLSGGVNSHLGDIWLNKNSTSAGVITQSQTQLGQSGYKTIVHEIGHALGLEHPFVLDSNGVITKDYLPAGHQNHLYSVMSYTLAPITYGGQQWYPSAPMLDDVLAIQTLYGPNMNSNATDTSYFFSIDPTKPDVKVIWDAGGTGDTFDAHNHTENVFIKLTPGEFSSIGTGVKTKAYISIAYNVDVNGIDLSKNFIENALGGSGNDELTGNDGNNLLEGNAGNDTLTGGIGNDTLKGGIGNDTYIVGVGDTLIETSTLSTEIDTVNSSITYTLGANVENLLLTGATVINGTGNTLNNVLNGSINTAANILIGSTGNDTYIIGAGDTVVETSTLTTEIDTVNSSITYILGANVENLLLTGATVINGTGNTLNNVLNGSINTTANILTGGTGNDTYVIGVGDTVVETSTLAAEIDTVNSSVSYTLGANVENLLLTGATVINGTGNTLNNVLNGRINTAANILTGGTGNDTYVVGIGDTVVETSSSATEIDTVNSTITYTLGTTYVENLTLTGAAIINGTGNTYNNVLTGNAAANILTGGAGNDTFNGGAGIDTLIGGLGDDSYVVETGDVISENVDEGNDTVKINDNLMTSVDFKNIETLQIADGRTALLTINTNQLEDLFLSKGADNITLNLNQHVAGTVGINTGTGADIVHLIAAMTLNLDRLWFSDITATDIVDVSSFHLTLLAPDYPFNPFGDPLSVNDGYYLTHNTFYSSWDIYKITNGQYTESLRLVGDITVDNFQIA